MNYQIDYEMVVVVLVTGILLVSIICFLHAQYIKKMEYEREFFNITIVTPTPVPVYPRTIISVPSEELCQSVWGYGVQEKAYLEKYFCEFNESGWHFNRTKYEGAL
jgi:hypothetical protein